MNLTRKNVAVVLLAVVCLMVFTAGSSLAQTPPLKFNGTIKYVNIEGGFWGIVADDGKNYAPLNLPDAFMQAGLPVQVEAVVKNRISIHMWGTPIEITNISKLGK